MGRRKMDSDLHRIKLETGTVYQTSKGGNYYFRYQINGERKCVSLKTANQEEALRKAKALLPTVQATELEVIASHVKVARKLAAKVKTLPLSQVWEVYSQHPQGKYVGESEENLRKAIRVAEATTPCILWIDEIEKAFAGIGSGGEVTTRLFGQFLTWMQEKKSAIYVVATANDISNLPPEFLRRGRFDEIFQVQFPNHKERKAILDIQLRRRNNDKIPDGINIDELAAALQDGANYSGADLESIVKEAMKKAFSDGMRTVKQSDILDVIKNTKSSYLSQKDKLDKMLEKLKSLGVKPASK